MEKMKIVKLLIRSKEVGVLFEEETNYVIQTPTTTLVFKKNMVTISDICKPLSRVLIKKLYSGIHDKHYSYSGHYNNLTIPGKPSGVFDIDKQATEGIYLSSGYVGFLLPWDHIYLLEECNG